MRLIQLGTILAVSAGLLAVTLGPADAQLGKDGGDKLGGDKKALMMGDKLGGDKKALMMGDKLGGDKKALMMGDKLGGDKKALMMGDKLGGDKKALMAPGAGQLPPGRQ